LKHLFTSIKKGGLQKSSPKQDANIGTQSKAADI
jgi:hypothetical protein